MKEYKQPRFRVVKSHIRQNLLVTSGDVNIIIGEGDGGNMAESRKHSVSGFYFIYN